MVTWGDEISGGYCSSVKAALRGVHKVYPTRKAFAPILKDGRYCCDLGNQNYGGDCSIVKATLRGLIRSTPAAFAAILKDPTVVTWGGKYDGGVCSNVKATLIGVDKIYFTSNAL